MTSHDGVQRALAEARRTPGWNNRRPIVRRFELPNRDGREPCVLIVVPARCWTFKRQGRAAGAWQRDRGRIA